MLHSRFLASAFLVFSASGCNLLFPELGGGSTPADLSLADLSGDINSALTVTGVVCTLSDVRVLGSCAAVSGHGLHVSVEETRDSAPVDSTGHFSVLLSQTISTATLGVSATDGTYLPTVVQVAVSRAELAIPVYEPQTLSNVVTDDGLSVDDTRALVLAYVVDQASVPVLGVKAAAVGAAGILYDGLSPNQLDANGATGANGVVMLVNEPAPSVTLALTPPAGSSAGANSFTLQTRPGAVTFAVTVLPPS